MPDFDTGSIQDDDEVKITHLASLEEGSRLSLSLMLLRFVRKIPLFATTRSRTTLWALLTCIFIYLFLVQAGLLYIPGKVSSSSALATSHDVDVQSRLSYSVAPTANEVTWIRISKGKVIAIQAKFGIIVWHDCKPRRWRIPRKYLDLGLSILICK